MSRIRALPAAATLTLLLCITVAPVVLVSAQAGTVPNYSPPSGALNPAVTQATIGQTICVPGWTKTVRPPRSFTDHLKRAQVRARHLPDRLSDYEEDHFIPLELGGASRNPNNLWPQPRDQAQRKNRWEVACTEQSAQAACRYQRLGARSLT